MSNYPIEYQKTKSENYWCEQEGKMVYKCNEANQCFQCALVQNEMEESRLTEKTKNNGKHKRTEA